MSAFVVKSLWPADFFNKVELRDELTIAPTINIEESIPK